MRPNQPDVLKNTTCCYCRKPLDNNSVTKEHVVARRFVPKGTLDRSWNLIARACGPCNVRKSDLEDDLAVLSMQHYPFGNDPQTDKLVSDTLAKASRTISRRTKRHVSESAEEHNFDFTMAPGFTMSVGMVSAPQADDARAYELANMQATAFFYRLTYNTSTNAGQLWQGGGFFPLDVEPRSDWGNPIHLWFMTTVAGWQPRLVATIAQGFVMVAIRRHPHLFLWSCALEWNQGLRVIALFGDESSARAVAATMPSLFRETDYPIPVPDGVVRFREEVPLKTEDDQMFVNGPPNVMPLAHEQNS